MLPAVVVPASVIARFGPYFGRVAAAKPGIVVSLVNALRKTGAVIEPTVKAVINYVKANPMQAATVFSILASLGVAVTELFENEDKQDPAARSSAATLDAVVARAHDANIPAPILAAAAASEKLDVGTMSQADTDVLKEVCGWALGFFGNPMRAMDAHAMLQGFLELPRARAQYAFDNLKLGR